MSVVASVCSRIVQCRDVMWVAVRAVLCAVLGLLGLPAGGLEVRHCPTGSADREPAPAGWPTRVYAPARRGFLERGTTPAHWRVAVSPAGCAAPRLLPDDDTVPYLVFANNGSLLERRAGRALPPAMYCAAPGLVMLCDGGGAGNATSAGSAAPPKCCPAGTALAGEEGARCESHGGAVDESDSRAALGGGWPACSGGRYARAGAWSDAVQLEGGALRVGDTELEAGGWCAERAGPGGALRVLTCESSLPRTARAGHHAVYGWAAVAGAAFLLATLCGTCGWSPGAGLHARCQQLYVSSLLVADVLLAVAQLAPHVPAAPCWWLAVCMHFFFLSAFFWLNTMCFNIWWTFRDFRPASLERGQERRRFRLCAVYAVGGPLLVAGAAAVLDAAGGAAVLRPRFAVRRCWFYGDREVLAYFFGPVGALLAVNAALFAATARQLACGLWRRDDLKASSERARLGRVCAKLVVVMGVAWLADVVSWAAGGPAALWYVTDVLNALQGLLVFLVVGHRPAWARCVRCATRCAGRGPPSRDLADSLTHTTHAAAPAVIPAPSPAVLQETPC